jgi:thiol:disulfide interchange protein DsbD
VGEGATVTLVSETDSYQPGVPVRLGLHFRMASGWHIYWRNPGDAGSPPDVSWSLPAGTRAGDIEWPAPLHEQLGPVTSYVYTDEVVLPVTFTPPPQGGPLEIQADANWVVCEKICISEEGKFRLSLPVGAARPDPAAPLFAAADARLPKPSPYAASVAPDGSLRVTGQGLGSGSVKDAWFFPATWGEIDQNAPEKLTVDDGGLTLALKPGAQFNAAQDLVGVLVLREPSGHERYLTVSAHPASP